MNLADMDLSQQLDRMKESFLWAAAKGGREEEVESLLSIGADVNWVACRCLWRLRLPGVCRGGMLCR